MSSKTLLTIVGVVIIVMGVMGLFFSPMFGVTDPIWHSITKIVVGLIMVYVGSTEKAK